MDRAVLEAFRRHHRGGYAIDTYSIALDSDVYAKRSFDVLDILTKFSDECLKCPYVIKADPAGRALASLDRVCIQEASGFPLLGNINAILPSVRGRPVSCKHPKSPMRNYTLTTHY